MKYYIETFTPKQAWLELSKEERSDYMNRIALSSQPLVDQGGEVVVMSENDSDTTQRLNHQFFVIWKFPSDELTKAFETLGINEGWYEYFDQFNIKGGETDINEKLINL
nr:DUF6616 family protein [uncultured Chryseobacterium sp.]